MDAPLVAEILILADNEATARRWAAVLEGPQVRVWPAADEVPYPSRLDLILTNRNLSDLPLAETHGQSRLGEEGVDAGGPGVIRIGAPGPADVHLPADVTERELRLSCRLLAQVVRLRRRELARSQVHRRLKQEALTDPITGLPNRRAWDRALLERSVAPPATAGFEPELAGPLAATPSSDRSTAAATPVGRLCVAVIDLDHFKRINDRHGYTVGDKLLRATGEAIFKNLRKDDFVARLGGDEFGLLLALPDETTARAVLDRVREGIPSGLARAGVPEVTASAGFHLAPPSNPTAPLPSPDALFEAADAALREAKRQGRDRTVGHLA